MNLRRRLPERISRLRGWLFPAAFLAFAPKCVVCVLAYAGLAGALGLGDPEICGTTPGLAGTWEMWPMLAGVALAAIGFLPRRTPSFPPKGM